MTINAIEQFEKLLKKSQYTVVLTGAGMSTESGLPDFRSANGLWKGIDPTQIASVTAMNHNREAFIEFYRRRIEQLQKYSYHIGHEILTTWQRQGLLQRMITQNVDGFHQQAASHDVIELHGTLRKVRCLSCNERFSSERYLEANGSSCPRCSGFLRPDLVLFGESLDESALSDAFAEASKAELFLVMGSSLQVSPANLLPETALDLGAYFVIINEGSTLLDTHAHLIIEGKIGEILSKIQV